MDYHDAVGFLFDLRRFSMSPGVDSVRALLAELGNPQESLDAVQVAGSNGKGSVSKMLESTLRQGDQRVGLFTSPHLDDVRERVRVDGRKVTRSAVAEFVERVKPYLVERAAEGEPLTFFEVVTALALWQFDRADVDVAVLEVGMGGEYDATSAVDPVAACVTNVTLEHTAVLGDTIEEIATTKAHVAPEGAPLVTAATDDALAAVREQAGDVLTVGGDGADVAVDYGGRTNHSEAAVSVAGDGWTVETAIPLLGRHQATNAGVAAALARQVDPGLSEAALARGLRNAHWPGRFEVMERDPTVVLDGAHNPGACETLAETLAEFDGDLHVVFAAMHDKDHEGMATALPTPASVRTCRPDTPRAEDPEVLARVWERETDGVDVSVGGAVLDALGNARRRAGDDDVVLVVGSLFCVAEARRAWTRLGLPKDVDSPAEAAALFADSGLDGDAAERLLDAAVSRVVKTRVDERQAEELVARCGEVDVDVGVADLEGGELLDVVLAGSRGGFRDLVTDLDDAEAGLDGVASEVREATGLASSPATGHPWGDAPAVMGVLNVTPDSFHDGGEFASHEAAVERARQLVEAGADVVDVGGESTRPGADPVSAETERERVVPVVEAVAGFDADVAVAVDTRKPEVARAALDAGADVLNDVTGLADPEMRRLAAERDVPVVVMHSIDAPVVAGRDVDYDDVVEDVVDELQERLLLAEKAGVERENVVVDPGFGFGKSPAENFELLDRLGELSALGCPVLVGHSHKSMFDLVGRGPDERLPATVAATALAVDRGADVVRVHDVAENVAAARVAAATDDPDRFAGDEP
jgi:dihydropteroate synthase